MARTDTTEGQALWQPGGAEEDSRFREGDRHLHLAYNKEEKYCMVTSNCQPPLPDVYFSGQRRRFFRRGRGQEEEKTKEDEEMTKKKK